MRILVTKVPGDTVIVDVPSGTTAGAAIDAARRIDREAIGDTTGHDIRINGTPGSGDRSLSDGDTVMVTKMIKGNL